MKLMKISLFFRDLEKIDEYRIKSKEQRQMSKDKRQKTKDKK